MATIIHLNPPQRAAAPAATGEARPHCEIVIFPGVRIERQEVSYTAEMPGPETDGHTHNTSRPRKSS